MVKPRIECIPKGKGELGKRAVDLIGEAGVELDDWQAYVLENSMKTTKERWSAREVGLCVSRQNGKNVILRARELAELYLVKSDLTIHSAQVFKTAREHFLHMTALIEETPRLKREVKSIRHSHGEEGFILKGNRRLDFLSRTKSAGRGFSADLVVFDEAMILSDASVAALFPTKRARPNPQIWYAGSAVDKEVHEHGVVFSRVRKNGIDGKGPLAYFEWSVEGDNPSTVPRSVLEDKAAWVQATPAIGKRITFETMQEELESSMGERNFAVELLSIGDWHDPDFVAAVLDVEAFLGLEDDRSILQNPVCIAFDVSPDRRASIACAGKNQDGLWHVEIPESRQGTGWLPERLVEMAARARPSEIVCDGRGPASSLVHELEQRGLSVRTFDSSEHGQACGQLVDLIEAKSLRHRGGVALLGAVRAARTRPLGDAWAWSRKDSSANISPLVSATLALSAAMTQTKPREVSWAF